MANRGSMQGVNIELGDDMSRMFYEASRQTFDNRPGFVFEGHESFRGFRAIRGQVFAKHIGQILFNLGFDGIGTRVELAERLNEHFGSFFNLLAMAADDAPVKGAEVIAVGSILDVNKLEEENETIKNGMRDLALGMIAAAEAAGVVVINGEIAELGYRIKGYGDFNYNWGAGVLWAAHEDRILTGHQIRPGDIAVGLVELGFRSNGWTKIRNGLTEHYGTEWHNQVDKSLGEATLGQLIQTPSTIYHKLMTELTGGFDIDKEPKADVTGVAHITGGGQPSKLASMLEPSGLGITIDKPIEPPEMMKRMQLLCDLDDASAYHQWHWGPGMVVVGSEPDKVIAEAAKFGIAAQEIGQVTDEPGIRILNKGAVQDEEWLRF